MFQESLRGSLAHVGTALKEPEAFALRWHRESADYRAAVWLALSVTAILGTTTYGITMGIGGGVSSIFYKSTLLTLAAGLAWAIPLPALYVLNSLAGSKLRASTTLLAALVTTSWGGLALVASVPISWFFSVAIPAQIGDLYSEVTASRLILAINLLVFSGVGLSMADVFGRVMHSLEPCSSGQPFWFLVLVAIIGGDLFYLFGLLTWL